MAIKPWCPACKIDLEGHLCPSCGGELALESEAAELLARLHIDRDFFKEILDETSVGGHSCPACKYAMSRVRVRGQFIDFCTGCGAMWLSVVERERMLEPPKPEPPPARVWEKRSTRVPGTGKTAIIGAMVGVLSAGWAVFLDQPILLGGVAFSALLLLTELTSRAKVDGRLGVVQLTDARIRIDEVVSVRVLGRRLMLSTKSAEHYVAGYPTQAQALEAKAVLMAACGLTRSEPLRLSSSGL